MSKISKLLGLFLSLVLVMALLAGCGGGGGAAEPQTGDQAAKKDIKDSDYQDFYKYIAHDFENPLLWTHNFVEGKL